MKYDMNLKLFGGMVRVTLYDLDKETAVMFEEEIEKEARRLQKIFNFYNPESELSRLNKERFIVPSEELKEVLLASVWMSEISEGSFDVSNGAVFLALKSGKPVPERKNSHDSISMGEQITLTDDSVLVDLGAIAKGYCTDRLGKFIMYLGIENFSIDARGDILVRDELGEMIEIRDPRSDSNISGSTILKNGAIATSGDYNQYQGSYENSHILGSSDLASVTVMADSLMEADAYATALFSMGLDRSLDLIRRHSLRAYLISADGNHIKCNWV